MPTSNRSNNKMMRGRSTLRKASAHARRRHVKQRGGADDANHSSQRTPNLPGEIWEAALRHLDREQIGRLRRVRSPGHSMVDQAARLDRLNRAAEEKRFRSKKISHTRTVSEELENVFRELPSTTSSELIIDMIMRHVPGDFSQFRDSFSTAKPVYLEWYLYGWYLHCFHQPQKSGAQWATLQNLPSYVLALMKALRQNSDVFLKLANTISQNAVEDLKKIANELDAELPLTSASSIIGVQICGLRTEHLGEQMRDAARLLQFYQGLPTTSANR